MRRYDKVATRSESVPGAELAHKLARSNSLGHLAILDLEERKNLPADTVFLALPAIGLLTVEHLVGVYNILHQRLGHLPLRIVRLIRRCRHLDSGRDFLRISKDLLPPPFELSVPRGRQAPNKGARLGAVALHADGHLPILLVLGVVVQRYHARCDAASHDAAAGIDSLDSATLSAVR